ASGGSSSRTVSGGPPELRCTGASAIPAIVGRRPGDRRSATSAARTGPLAAAVARGGGRAHVAVATGAVVARPVGRRCSVVAGRLAPVAVTGRPPAHERQHAPPLGLAGRHLGGRRAALEVVGR